MPIRSRCEHGNDLTDQGVPLPSDLILFPRRVLYIQAALFVVVAGVAFTAGYYMGRGDATFEKEIQQQAKARQRVLVEGKLTYRSSNGEVGDKDAVIILLPAENLPPQPLSIDGIRPEDEPPAESHPTVSAIVGLGGGYARADADGVFWLRVPGQGQYRALLISRHVTRPEGAALAEADLMEIGKYLAPADRLVDRFKCVWRTVDVGQDPRSLDHDFGQDGRK
jgi:hypothetical protein